MPKQDLEETLFDEAVREVAETGELSFPTRRRLWLELGPHDPRDEMDDDPRALTGPLKIRAGLAIACAKKVMPVWSRFAPDDKEPQKLLKAAQNYLAGKLTAEQLDKALHEAGGFLDRAENEPYSTAPAAAMAVWSAAIAARDDEHLLEDWFADARDGEIDYDDWDAAYLASIAWSGRDEGSQPGERAVQRMKFWAWYLEQLAPLLGREKFHFSRKALEAFKEKQTPPKALPQEVTLESFCDYIGAGDYIYHIRNLDDPEKTGDWQIFTRMRGDHAVCPATKQECRELKFYYGVSLLKGTLTKGNSLNVCMWVPLFHCDEHPGDSHTPRAEYGNTKADMKRFFGEDWRTEAFLWELQERAVNAFVIGEGYTELNGVLNYHHNLHIPAGIEGIRWLDMETETLEIDLRKFGPHVYFPNCNWEDFQRFYPDRIVPREDGSSLVTFQRHWVRCYPGEDGQLQRVTITSRFKLEVEWFNPNNKNQSTYNPGKKLSWVKALKTAFDLPTDEARAWVEDPDQPWRERFQNLTRRQAERLQSVLRSNGIKCRIMPWRVGVSGDTQLR